MSSKRKILIFENTYTLTNYLFEQWIKMAQEAIRRSNRFTVALSGGRSPMEFYCKLSSLRDFSLWQRTHIFLGDERFVPWEDNSSNFKMIKENLLDYVNIPTENIHPIPVQQKNVALCADQYKEELVQFFEFNENNAPRFDFILLGIGTDGHTASLYPDDDQVDLPPGRLVLPVTLPRLKHERITLTLPVINNARHIMALMIGASKAEIINQIVEKNLIVPMSKVDPSNGQLTYLLDREAAQKLSYKDSYIHEDQGVFYEFEK
ncbi:MAG TPA: 6-phosphogluconolactonase [Candidatus Omnitrophota bacterium]|nr:6-phosphogluconolactonase [Candidatus Omnitrophota bacterium]